MYKYLCFSCSLIYLLYISTGSQMLATMTTISIGWTSDAEVVGQKETARLKSGRKILVQTLFISLAVSIINLFVFFFFWVMNQWIIDDSVIDFKLFWIKRFFVEIFKTMKNNSICWELLSIHMLGCLKYIHP